MVSQGLSIIPVVADILSEDGVGTVMDRARAAPGNFYGLVTVIGGAPPPTWGPAHRLSREHWRAQLSLNLDSMFFMMQGAAAELKALRRPGSLIAISSINGLTSSPFNVGYGAGKAAIQSVVQTMALELALDGIRVNAVAPGPTDTPTASLADDPERNRRGIPMGRHGQVDEIAGPVLFLLSDWSSYMTGQCLIVDGGCNIKWCHLTEENVPMFLKPSSVLEAIKR
jgi:NAD(P)-dependent dehydrogenase (short-subunit alcohol dehydrogenase family)